jgi:hypothetical protein
MLALAPWVIFKSLAFLFLTQSFISISLIRILDPLSARVFQAVYIFGRIVSIVERKLVFFLSIIMGGIITPLERNRRNQPVLQRHRYFGKKFGILDKEFKSVPSIIRYGIRKKGYLLVSLQFVNMFAFIPLYKYLLTTNPFLFDLRDHVTNQWTDAMQDIPTKQLLLAFKEYLAEPKGLSDIPQYYRYAPNFVIDTDDENPRDFDNFGLQLIPWVWGCLINLESNSGFALEEFIELDRGHHFIIDLGDKFTRYNMLRLMVHYDNPFYVLTSYVELNLRLEENSIEHPMYGMDSNSYLSQYVWSGADRLFKGSVAWKVKQYISDKYSQSIKIMGKTNEIQ